MGRYRAALLTVLISLSAFAQYPITRSFDVRIAQQRPRFTALLEGPNGLIWCASDLGLVRTDGVRHVLMLRTAPHAVISLTRERGDVLAATDHGLLLRCHGSFIDTVLMDTALAHTPVRAMTVTADGSIWLGTYGGGLRVIRNEGVRYIPAGSGLSDGHINALCALPDGSVAAATDQGIDIFDPAGTRSRTINAASGAPDNLVLSLACHDGALYAGTDRAGVFVLDPVTGRVGPGTAIQTSQPPVIALTVDDRSIWSGTDGSGLWLRSREHGTYAPPADLANQRIMGLSRASDGTIWWCDGTDRLFRSDPEVLLVPQHEGVDLRSITAIDVSRDGRIAIATGNTIHTHSTAFSDHEHLTTVVLPLAPNAQIACVHMDRWDHIWVGTMGQGILRIGPDGDVAHYTERDGGLNDNVLSIRSGRDLVWFATLSGVGIWRPVDSSATRGVFERIETPGYGFIYDVLPAGTDEAYAATDGNGVLHIKKGGPVIMLSGSGEHDTYYSLCQDSTGGIWAAGPHTGFCRVGDTAMTCMAAGSPLFEDEVFGLVFTQGRLLMLGAAGMAASPLDTASLADPSDALGLSGVTVPLNGMRPDPGGGFWVACDRGLVRLRPRAGTLSSELPAAITDLHWGDRPLATVDGSLLDHEQNYLTFGFTAVYAGSPERIAFQFQLEGYDRDVRTTQDREVQYARLGSGDYTFRVRAIMPGTTPTGAWSTLRFTIAAPWWRTPMAMVGIIVLSSVALLLVLRARDQRIRFKERMEREKVRFQLEAVRSQVNPHFLFNSFNTLIELIEEDRSKAIAHTQQLSDFFRNILQVRDKDLITLAEDLVLLENYYALERRRFGERIMLELQVDDDQSRWAVPPLTLQLLVENALKHNAATLDDPLVVKVTAMNGWLRVSNAHRPRSTSTRSTGFGLESLRKRFEVLTDRPMTAGVKDGEFVVEIPLIAPEP